MVIEPATITESIRSGSISLPKGQSHEERKAYIKTQLDEEVVVGCIHHCGCHSLYAIVKRSEVVEKQKQWHTDNKRLIADYVDGEFTTGMDILTIEQAGDWDSYFRKKLQMHKEKELQIV